MTSTHLLVTKDKVQRFAKQFFNIVQIGENGELSIPFESTHVFIEVHDLSITDSPEFRAYREENDISKTIVNLWAVVLMDVKVTPELCKWVAVDGQDFDFGAFRILLHQDNPNMAEVQFQYRLAGDTLDPGELKNALATVALTANNLDDELQQKFGGKRVEDVRQ